MDGKPKTSLATKFALTYALVFFGVMILLAAALRFTVTGQFNKQYKREVDATLETIRSALSTRREIIRNQLKGFGAILHDDRDFRYKVLFEPDFRLDGYILDYAQSFMPTMGLDVLEIVDHRGRVISSGHARQSFGRDAQALIRYYKMSPGKELLAEFTGAGDEMVCLSVIDSVRFGGKPFYLLGGVAIDTDFLNRLRQNDDEIVLLVLPQRTLGASHELAGLEKIEDAILLHQEIHPPAEIEENYAAGHFTMPAVSGDLLAEAYWLFFYPKATLHQILESFNRRMLFIFSAGILLVILLSIWRTRVITKPLRRLSEAAGGVSFDNPKIAFQATKNDEVGVLAASLRRMVWRLKRDKRELLQAEQKAAYAEVARQVNHDIKNGFLPIRNVMDHWREVAKDAPDDLAAIFTERESTVAESLDYLENLAKDYAQMRQTFKREPIRIQALIESLLENYQEIPGKRIRFNRHFSKKAVKVVGDAVQLRRAFENVLRNAIEAIPESGVVTVGVEENDEKIIITWQDDGVGISQKTQEQLFYSRITTKADGTGLGLTNVRRIVEEMGGSVSLESVKGEGTTVRIIFNLNF